MLAGQTLLQTHAEAVQVVGWEEQRGVLQRLEQRLEQSWMRREEGRSAAARKEEKKLDEAC